MNLEGVERDLKTKLDALGPRVRGEPLKVLMLPDYDRARRIGDHWLDPRSRTFAELLIDARRARPSQPSSYVLGALMGRAEPKPPRCAAPSRR